MQCWKQHNHLYVFHCQRKRNGALELSYRMDVCIKLWCYLLQCLFLVVVLTNAHILRPYLTQPIQSFSARDPIPQLNPSSLILVTTSITEGSNQFSADLVYISPPPLDAALLRVNDEKFRAAPVQTTLTDMSVGMRVFVAGYPLFGAGASMYTVHMNHWIDRIGCNYYSWCIGKDCHGTKASCYATEHSCGESRQQVRIINAKKN